MSLFFKIQQCIKKSPNVVSSCKSSNCTGEMLAALYWWKGSSFEKAAVFPRTGFAAEIFSEHVVESRKSASAEPRRLPDESGRGLCHPGTNGIWYFCLRLQSCNQTDCVPPLGGVLGSNKQSIHLHALILSTECWFSLQGCHDAAYDEDDNTQVHC